MQKTYDSKEDTWNTWHAFNRKCIRKCLVSNPDSSFRSGLERWPIFEASFRDDYRPTEIVYQSIVQAFINSFLLGSRIEFLKVSLKISGHLREDTFSKWNLEITKLETFVSHENFFMKILSLFFLFCCVSISRLENVFGEINSTIFMEIVGLKIKVNIFRDQHGGWMIRWNKLSS